MLHIREKSLLKSKKSVIEALQANKDFVVADVSSPWYGRQVNLQDLKKSGESRIQVRYRGNKRVTILDISDL